MHLRWCHGAPGILIMLSTFFKRSLLHPEQLPVSQALHDKIITAFHRGASLVYRHGLLRKGVGLCHGTGGSVFALLAVSDILNYDEKHFRAHVSNETSFPLSTNYYLLHAIHLAHLAASHEDLTDEGHMSVPDHPWSLYEGVAGMCCAWAEVLYRLDPRSGARSRLKEGKGMCSGMPGFDDIDADR